MTEFLTPRQLEFLALSASGLNRAEIARQSFVAESTVKTTLRAARDRTKSTNTTQCVAYAIATEQLILAHDGRVLVPKKDNPPPR